MMKAKRSNFFLCVLLLLFFTKGQSAELHINIQHWVTHQDVPVYFVQAQQIPMVDMNVLFSAGSAYDQEKWGLASLTANLIDEGTTHRTADQIARELDQIGAQYSVDTDRDKIKIHLRTLIDPNYLNSALEILTDLLTGANFPDEAIARVKKETIAAIQYQQQDPGSVAQLAFFKALYQDQPYGHPVLGTIDSVKGIQRTAIDDFYHQYFVAKNAKIVLVGNLTRQQAEGVAEKITNILPMGTPASSLSLMEIKQHPIQLHINFPSKQTSILVGQLGITRQDPDFFPLLVGNYILGVLPSDSLLFHEVRNQRGLSYGVNSAFLPLAMPGPFVISLKTRANLTSDALSVVRQVLQQFLQDGMTEDQLNLAKNNIDNSFPLELSTNSDILHVVSEMIFYHLPLNYLQTYQDKVKAVTQEQVKQAFDRHLDINKMVTVTVGPSLAPSPPQAQEGVRKDQ